MMFHLRSLVVRGKKETPKQRNAKRQKDKAMTNIPDNVPCDFNPETAPPALTIDWDAYLPFFEDEDISEDQKHELIAALWSIMVSFVDLGFGIHPVQMACGKNVSLAKMPISDVLDFNNTRTTFEHAAAPTSDAQQEGSL